MTQGRIVLVSGAPGTGKSTVAALLARDSTLERSLLLHTDNFYDALCKGAIPPHKPGSQEQNRIVIEAFREAANALHEEAMTWWWTGSSVPGF